MTPKVRDKPIITARNTVVQNLLAQQTNFRAGRLRDYIKLWEGVTSDLTYFSMLIKLSRILKAR